MTTYEKSLRLLKKELKQRDISEEEWNELAINNCLYSALTIKAKENAKDWGTLKRKLLKRKEGTRKIEYDEYLYTKIKKLERKLNKSIEENGLNSIKTIEISRNIDELINSYYEKIEKRIYLRDKKMYEWYLESYDMLKYYTIDINRFPSESEWNKVAKRSGLMSAESIKYMSNMRKWALLKRFMEKEVDFRVIEKNN